MKIERDKWYVMRNGEKVRVVCVDAPGEYPVVAVWDDEMSPASFTADGRFNKEFAKHKCDLISEHREPARVWVNFYSTCKPEVFETANQALAGAHPFVVRTAVEFVEVVNGRDDS